MSAPVPLPARTDAAALAVRAVGRAASAAAALTGDRAPLEPDPTRIAIAYSSERWLRIDGVAPVAFAPLSGFFSTRDGCVRTHANYPRHRRALLHALRVSADLPPDADRDAVVHALLARSTAEAVAAVAAAGGLCVPVRAERPEADAAWRRAPLVAVERVGEGAPRPLPQPDATVPLRGIRVLDLTRVIAGPVATRTLAQLGAEVLRLDPPHLPELPHQHLDTGHGKRSALLDLRTSVGAGRFDELLATADIVALGYRRDGLERLGLTPAVLARRRPGIIVLALSAWGTPSQRGFDSLVQAESGIALLEGDDGCPGALPAQALDHSAGYLLAAAAMELLARRGREGGSWLAHTSLRRVAAELLGLPRTADRSPGGLPSDATGHTQSFTVDGHQVTTAAPAFHLPGGRDAFSPPRPWGQDEPAWT